MQIDRSQPFLEFVDLIVAEWDFTVPGGVYKAIVMIASEIGCVTDTLAERFRIVVPKRNNNSPLYINRPGVTVQSDTDEILTK